MYLNIYTDKSEFNRYGITNPKIVAETLARG